jgi:hypothetical protein
VAFVPAVSSPKQAMPFLSVFFYHHYLPKYRKYLYWNSNSEQVFWVCDLCSFSLLAETSNAGIIYVLLPSLVTKVQKTSSPGLKPRTVLQGCGLCFCNLCFETDNFGLGAILLSCLAFELQEPPSLGLNSGHFFRVLTFLKSLPDLKE